MECIKIYSINFYIFISDFSNYVLTLRLREARNFLNEYHLQMKSVVKMKRDLRLGALHERCFVVCGGWVYKLRTLGKARKGFFRCGLLNLFVQKTEVFRKFLKC